MKGIINLYKPKGISSAQAVGRVKRLLGTRAVGHMGTLDPAGEGVLLLGVGKATRLFDFFLGKDKVYEADFAFGYETDTLDGEGVVVARSEGMPTLQQIQAVCAEFEGELDQLPPRYSAKSVGGRRAYDLARHGAEFTLNTARVHVYDFSCLGPADNRQKDCLQSHETTAFQTDSSKRSETSNEKILDAVAAHSAEKSVKYTFRVHCSSGTYIRSLCRDLANRLNSKATMTAIKRTRCGCFYANNAVTFDQIEACGADSLIGIDEALKDVSVWTLDESMYRPLCTGIKIPCDREGIFAVHCCGQLFGLGKSKEGILKIITYLRD